MKKVVLTLVVHDDKDKQKAMKKVSGLAGVDSIALDMKDKKLTVIGDIDPVSVVSKLKKLYYPKIVSVGPAKEEKKEAADPKKKDQADQKGNNKDKGGGGKDADGKDKKDGPAPKSMNNAVPFPIYYPPPQFNYPVAMPYQYHQQPAYHHHNHPPPPHPDYFIRSVDEDPNACVIC